MSSHPADLTELVTVVVSHAVHPDDEAAFLAWQRRLSDAERRSPGHRGDELLPPVPGVQDDWGAVTRFATEHDLETWLASPARRDLLAEGARFRDFARRARGPDRAGPGLRRRHDVGAPGTYRRVGGRGGIERCHPPTS